MRLRVSFLPLFSENSNHNLMDPSRKTAKSDNQLSHEYQFACRHAKTRPPLDGILMKFIDERFILEKKNLLIKFNFR